MCKNVIEKRLRAVLCQTISQKNQYKESSYRCEWNESRSFFLSGRGKKDFEFDDGRYGGWIMYSYSYVMYSNQGQLRLHLIDETIKGEFSNA